MRSRWITGQNSRTISDLCRGTQKVVISRRLVVPVQALEALRFGENRPSQEASPTPYEGEVVSIMLTRKALNTLSH